MENTIWSSEGNIEELLSMSIEDKRDYIKNMVGDDEMVDSLSDDQVDEYIENLDDDEYRYSISDFNDSIRPMIERQCRDGIVLLSGIVDRWNGNHKAGKAMLPEDLINLKFDRIYLINNDGNLVLAGSDHDGSTEMKLYSIPENDKDLKKFVNGCMNNAIEDEIYFNEVNRDEAVENVIYYLDDVDYLNNYCDFSKLGEFAVPVKVNDIDESLKLHEVKVKDETEAEKLEKEVIKFEKELEENGLNYFIGYPDEPGSEIPFDVFSKYYPILSRIIKAFWVEMGGSSGKELSTEDGLLLNWKENLDKNDIDCILKTARRIIRKPGKNKQFEKSYTRDDIDENIDINYDNVDYIDYNKFDDLQHEFYPIIEDAIERNYNKDTIKAIFERTLNMINSVNEKVTSRLVSKLRKSIKESLKNYTPEEILENVGELIDEIPTDGEPAEQSEYNDVFGTAEKVMESYQNANKWLDSVKEFVYSDLSCVFFSSLIHELAHTMPGRFDKFGDILHTIDMKIPYPATAYIPNEPSNIDEVFDTIFMVLDNIKEALNNFIKETDENYHGMACAAEELLNDIEGEYPMLYRLRKEWNNSNGDMVAFDKYVGQYVEHRDNLLESYTKRLNESILDVIGDSKLKEVKCVITDHRNKLDDYRGKLNFIFNNDTNITCYIDIYGESDDIYGGYIFDEINITKVLVNGKEVDDIDDHFYDYIYNDITEEKILEAIGDFEEGLSDKIYEDQEPLDFPPNWPGGSNYQE